MINFNCRDYELEMAPSLYSDINARSRSYTNLHTFSVTSSDIYNNNNELFNLTSSSVSEDDSTKCDISKDDHANTRERPYSFSGTLPRQKRQSRSNLTRAPSQLTMHHTTVPQAIVPSKLGSRN